MTTANPPTPITTNGDGTPRPATWYGLVHSRADGGVSSFALAMHFATYQEERLAYEEWARDNVEDGQTWEVVPLTLLREQEANLGGMYFWNAFNHSPGGYGIRMDFARAIFRHHIREVRKPLLEALDIEFIRAQEDGNDTADIVRRKRALRDLPQAAGIAAATTAQELLALWPTDLLGERDTAGRGLPSQGYYESADTF